MQKEETREKSKPEEKEGMHQQRHCPPGIYDNYVSVSRLAINKNQIHFKESSGDQEKPEEGEQNQGALARGNNRVRFNECDVVV
jgi:hypothetical protein